MTCPKVTQVGEKSRAESCPTVPCIHIGSGLHICPSPTWPGTHTFANDAVTVGDHSLMGNQHILDLSQERRVQDSQLEGFCLQQRDTGPIPTV